MECIYRHPTHIYLQIWIVQSNPIHLFLVVIQSISYKPKKNQQHLANSFLLRLRLRDFIFPFSAIHDSSFSVKVLILLFSFVFFQSSLRVWVGLVCTRMVIYVCVRSLGVQYHIIEIAESVCNLKYRSKRIVFWRIQIVQKEKQFPFR